MILDYEALKDLATATGCRVSDLKVLTNDPFYVRPTWRRDGEWFAEIWQALGARHGVHLRRIHYAIVSQAVTAHRVGQAGLRAWPARAREMA